MLPWQLVVPSRQKFLVHLGFERVKLPKRLVETERLCGNGLFAGGFRRGRNIQRESRREVM
jgi:hypothetical protein